MKRIMMALLVTFVMFLFHEANAQCSICTKTAQQLGHKPAKALNTGIIYLMVAPLAIMGYVGYRWWRNNSQD